MAGVPFLGFGSLFSHNRCPPPDGCRKTLAESRPLFSVRGSRKGSVIHRLVCLLDTASRHLSALYIASQPLISPSHPLDVTSAIAIATSGPVLTPTIVYSTTIHRLLTIDSICSRSDPLHHDHPHLPHLGPCIQQPLLPHFRTRLLATALVYAIFGPRIHHPAFLQSCLHPHTLSLSLVCAFTLKRSEHSPVTFGEVGIA